MGSSRSSNEKRDDNTSLPKSAAMVRVERFWRGKEGRNEALGEISGEFLVNSGSRDRDSGELRSARFPAVPIYWWPWDYDPARSWLLVCCSLIQASTECWKVGRDYRGAKALPDTLPSNWDAVWWQSLAVLSVCSRRNVWLLIFGAMLCLQTDIKKNGCIYNYWKKFLHTSSINKKIQDIEVNVLSSVVQCSKSVTDFITNRKITTWPWPARHLNRWGYT